MIKKVILFSILISTVAVYAQTKSVSIVLQGIKNVKDYQAIIEGQPFLLEIQKSGALIDSFEKTKFLKLPYGTHRLVILKGDRKDWEKNKQIFSLQINANTPEKLSLSIKEKKLNRILEVSQDLKKEADSINLNQKPYSSKKVITASESMIASASATELINILNSQIPGVSGDREIFYRGNYSDSVGYFFDGIPIENGFHAFGYHSLFPIGMLSHLSFYKGLSPNEYSPNDGVLIDFIPKKLDNTDKISGRIHMQIYALDASFFIPLLDNKLALTMSGRVSAYNVIFNFLNLLVTLAGSPGIGVDLFFNDGFAAIEYKPTKNNEIYIWGATSTDDLEFKFDGKEELNEQVTTIIGIDLLPIHVGTNFTFFNVKAQYNWYAGMASHKYKQNAFENKLKFSVAKRQDLSSSKTLFSSEYNDKFKPFFEDQNNLRDFSSTNEYEATKDSYLIKDLVTFAKKPYVLKGGVEYLYERNFLKTTHNSPFRKNYNATNENHYVSTFLEGGYEIGPLDLNASLKAVDVIGGTELDPKIKLSHKITPDWHWHASVGKQTGHQKTYFHLLSFQKIVVEQDEIPVVNHTDETSTKPYSWQYLVGSKVKFLNSLSLEGDAYYKTFSNQPIPIYRYDNFFRATEQLAFVYHGNGLAYGGRIGFKKDLKKDLYFYSFDYVYDESFSEYFNMGDVEKAMREISDNDYSKLKYQDLEKKNKTE